MKQVGFTVAELVVVITIMGILMGLGTIQIIGSKSKARDTERKSDIETIAMHLENLYQSGNYDDPISDNNFAKGKYPSTSNMASEEGGPADLAKTLLRDIDIKALYSPGKTGDESDVSLIVASANTELDANNLDIDQYLYMPLTDEGELCEGATDECRKFYLYAKLENAKPDGITEYIYKVESKNQ